MKDSEILAWEDKAKIGLLRGDTDLKKAYNELRQGSSQPATGLVGAY